MKALVVYITGSNGYESYKETEIIQEGVYLYNFQVCYEFNKQAQIYEVCVDENGDFVDSNEELEESLTLVIEKKTLV